VGHGDRIPGVQPIVTAVPLHRAAQWGGAAVPQRQRRRALVGVAHPPHLRKPLCPRQIATELGEHAPAGLHGSQLMRVADQHGLGAGLGGGREQLAQIVGADHAGFVDHDHRAPIEPQRFVTQRFERLGDGVPDIAGALARRDINGFSGWRHHDHGAPGPVRGGDQGAHRGGLARPGRRGERAHQPGCGGDVLHRALLVGRQRRGVLVFDPQQRAGVAGIDQIQHSHLFSQDAIQRELFMSFALMRRPRRGQPHPDLVDGGLHELARGAFGVDGQLRTHQLHQIDAGERRLIDPLRGCRQPAPIKRRS